MRNWFTHDESGTEIGCESEREWERREIKSGALFYIPHHPPSFPKCFSPVYLFSFHAIKVNVGLIIFLRSQFLATGYSSTRIPPPTYSTRDISRAWGWYNASRGKSIVLCCVGCKAPQVNQELFAAVKGNKKSVVPVAIPELVALFLILHHFPPLSPPTVSRGYGATVGCLYTRGLTCERPNPPSPLLSLCTSGGNFAPLLMSSRSRSFMFAHTPQLPIPKQSPISSRTPDPPVALPTKLSGETPKKY
ncbi:hypothetical protein V8E53_003917 [Lactarius tabidus]